MKWKFWGVRGSIPTPEKNKLKYGGNTSCYQLIIEESKDAFIFDAGTGIRKLGKQLLQEGVENYHLFISHIHWDHIQGLPFFLPLYVDKSNLYFYGALKVDSKLKDSLRGQMDSFYFPVKLDELRANMIFTEIIEEVLFVGNVKLTVRYQIHPGGSLGFRIEYGGKSIAYCTDSELPDKDKIPKSFSDLATGVDVLIMDAMYDEEDYLKSKKGWGHASWQRVVEFSKKVGVKKLYLTHHDPEISDRQLEERLEEGRKIFPNLFLAQEGEEVIIETGFKSENDKKKLDGKVQLDDLAFLNAPEKLKVTFDEEKEILYIELPPLDRLEKESFEISLNEFTSIRGVCFDFSKLESIDSRRLGHLVNLLKIFLDENIPCVAYGINDYLDHLLRITNVYKYVAKCSSKKEMESILSNIPQRDN